MAEFDSQYYERLAAAFSLVLGEPWTARMVRDYVVGSMPLSAHLYRAHREVAEEAAAIIRETAHPDVNMIFGAVIDPNMGDDIRVTVIATGFDRSSMPRRALERQPKTETRRADPSLIFPRATESVSVHADVQPGEAKQASLPPVNKDDLDIPTFLRNRR